MSDRDWGESDIAQSDIAATRDETLMENDETEQIRAAPRVAPPVDYEDIDTGTGGMATFDPAADRGSAGGIGRGLGRTRDGGSTTASG